MVRLTTAADDLTPVTPAVKGLSWANARRSECDGLTGTCHNRGGTDRLTAYPEGMSEEPVTVSADGLESWNDAVNVADVVPSGESERLRETIEVLSDTDLMQDIRDGLADLQAGNVVPCGDIAADLRARSTR